MVHCEPRPRPGPGHENQRKTIRKNNQKSRTTCENIIFPYFPRFSWPAVALGSFTVTLAKTLLNILDRAKSDRFICIFGFFGGGFRDAFWRFVAYLLDGFRSICRTICRGKIFEHQVNTIQKPYIQCTMLPGLKGKALKTKHSAEK